MKLTLTAAVLVAGGVALPASAQQFTNFQSTLPAKGTAAQSHSNLAVGVNGSDDCASATGIAGEGTFSFDTTASTTGAEGQAEALCYFFGSTGIDNDIWYAWTADSDGTATFTTCGGTTADTKLAVYDGVGCPVDGTSIGCNDDACGLQSSIDFAATNGNTYLLQLGSFPGAVGGTGTFDISILGSGNNGSDDCATATSISGQGQFGFDTTASTTGAEGQVEALCYFFGATGIDNDIWYEWTADADGTATVQTCALTTADTKLAIYDGSGCPADGTSIVCNDDNCGLQSGVQFSVTNGGVYTIQLGSFPGAVGGTGQFDISIAGAVTNDDCAAPEVIAGQGIFAFNTIGATTGAEGQAEALCYSFGSSAIDSDVWFEWTADADGIANVTTCGLTSVDTKIAAYDGSGCPADGTAIACNDDACAYQSSATFPVVNGGVYTIQLGTFPGAAQGAGDFEIEINDPPCGYTRDDGGSTDALGVTAGADVLYLNYFDAAFNGGTDVIKSVSVAFGTPGGSVGLDGLPAVICVYDDPTNDGDPSDAVLLHSQVETVVNANTDILNTFTVPDVAVSGQFLVGAAVNSALFVAAFDGDNPSGGLAWIVGNVGAALDFNNLGANSIPPSEMASIGFDGTFLARAGSNSSDACGSLGTIYCDPAVANSTGLSSGIAAFGSDVVADQDFSLSAFNMPAGQTVLFLGSQTQTFVAAPGCCNVGNLCVGGNFARFTDDVQSSSAGGKAGITVDLNNILTNPPQPVLAGQTWNFQAWHRDNGGSSNMTNAVEVPFN